MINELATPRPISRTGQADSSAVKVRICAGWGWIPPTTACPLAVVEQLPTVQVAVRRLVLLPAVRVIMDVVAPFDHFTCPVQPLAVRFPVWPGQRVTEEMENSGRLLL